MKNLQTEYIKDIENDVPDLWNRIEKGLDEIEKPAETQSTKKVVPFYSTKAFKVTCETVGIAACLFILVSVFLSNGGLKIDSTKNSSPASYAPMASVAESTACYEASPSYEEDTVYAESEDSTVYEKAEATANGSEILDNTDEDGITDIKESSVLSSVETDDNSSFLIPDRESEITELDDGTYMLDGRIYSYKLVLTGPMGISSDGFCTVLSNKEDITFNNCIAASPLGSDTTKYFDPEETVIVKFEVKQNTR